MKTKTSFLHSLTTLAYLLVATGVLSFSSLNGQTLLNGGFESLPGTGSNTFADWVESGKNANYPNYKNVASDVTEPSLVIAGNHTAQIDHTSDGWLRQNVGSPSTSFEFSFSFAVFDPGSASNVNQRALQVILRSELEYQGSLGLNTLNLIVTDDSNNSDSNGMLYVYNINTWIAVPGLSVNFSTDTNGNGIFDIGDVMVVNTLSISGNYDATPSYFITLNGVTSAELNYFQGTAPANSSMKQIVFSASTGDITTKNYLVDSVVIVPEPTTSMLVCLVLALAAGIRQYQRRVSKE